MKLAKVLGMAVGFAGIIWLERKYSLRKPVEDANQRLLRNSAIGLISAITLQLLERPLALKASRDVQSKRLGLLYWLRVPESVQPILGTILMDYTLYHWHVMLHKVPFLWQYHIAHHTDLDLDTSTTWRFHFGELIPSVVWRLLQIRLLGINARTLNVWQTFLISCILFHHSNWRLPVRFECNLLRVLVSPRMHGIHHSIIYEEQNSNWSSGLTLWDRLHGTLNIRNFDKPVVVGVPAYLDERKVGFWNTLLLPYTKVEDEWNLPQDRLVTKSQ